MKKIIATALAASMAASLAACGGSTASGAAPAASAAASAAVAAPGFEATETKYPFAYPVSEDFENVKID